MAMFDYSGPKFDFAPLANLADPILDQMEKRRAGEELQKYVAAQLGGQSLAGLAPAAAPAAPAAPSMTGGARQAMVMPPEAYAPLIQKAAAEHNVDPDLLTRLLKQESSFNPNALSSAGAMGVAQFMPGTAKRFGIDPTIPEQAIPAAAKYVAANRELFGGNTGLALAGYNWGEGNVQKWLKAGANPNQMPAETRDYVAKITGKPVEGWLTGQNVAAADIPVAGGAAAQFVVPQGDRTPATTEVKPGVGQGAAAVGSGVSPEQRARIMAGVASTVPAVRAAALAELHQIVQPKNPMSLGNGILYDPRTGKVHDFSNTQKPPEEYRKYLLERSDPGFAAHQEVERQTKDPKQKVESAYDVEQAKTYQELFKHTQEEGRNSAGTLGNLRAMDRLIDNPDFYSGTGGSAATAIKRALVSIGVKDAKSAQPNELFEKLANRALLDASGGKLGAGFSNADREFMGRTAANIENTPQGNRAIISMAKQVEGRKQEIAGMAREYARSHGGRLDSGFDEQLAKYAEANPLFAEQGPAIPDNLSAPRGPSYLPPGLPPPGTPSSERKTPTGVRWSF